MRISGAATQIQNQGVILRVVEDASLINLPSQIQSYPATLYGVGGFEASTSLAQLFNDESSGVVNSNIIVAGRVIKEMQGQAGSTTYRQSSTRYRIPCTVLYQDPNAIPLATLPVRPWEYLVETPVRITVQDQQFQLLIGGSNSGVGFGGTTVYGIAWSSSPALNGGAWTLKYRLQSGAGSIIVQPSSGVPPTSWHRLGFRYTQGAIPKIEALIDGVPRFTLQGDAQMLNTASVLDYPRFIHAIEANSTLTRVQLGPSMYQIRET